jgi:hypothetical protein
VAVLAVPYLAGAFGGLLTIRTAPILALETAPLWGFACGTLTGCVLGVISVFAGGPLGDRRLAAVGPSGWQVGVVAALEVGVAAAVTAGVANWWRLRAAAGSAAAESAAEDEVLPGFAAVHLPDQGTDHGAEDDGHTIYFDPWAGTADLDPPDARASPSSLP